MKKTLFSILFSIIYIISPYLHQYSLCVCVCFAFDKASNSNRVRGQVPLSIDSLSEKYKIDLFLEKLYCCHLLPSTRKRKKIIFLAPPLASNVVYHKCHVSHEGSRV